LDPPDCKSIIQNDVPNLSHLVCLRLSGRKWLKIDDLFDTLTTENVMISTNPFFEV